MESIAVLERGIIAPFVELRRPCFAHRWHEYAAAAPEQVAAAIADASIVILSKVRADAGNLAQAGRLRLISVLGTGTDNIDLTWCRDHGIAVCNARGYATHSVPEHTFALMLALARNLAGYREDLHAGQWSRTPHFSFFNQPVFDLHGKLLAIYGSGSIGRAVADLARAFGMHPQFVARKGEAPAAGRIGFDQALRDADIHSLHCPLTDATRGLFGLAEFRRMKRRALVVNTARGGLIAAADLVAAIDGELIAGVALDVLEPEPPPAEHPLVQLSRRRNVLLTPHSAWASREAMQALLDQAIENIENFVAGKPSNLCN